MSTDLDPAAAPIRALGLELIREFARTQHSVDWVVGAYFKQTTPDLQFWLDHRGVLKRIDDGFRPRLLQAVATAWKVDTDLSKYEDVFRKCKEMRNLLSHSAQMVELDADRLEVTRRVHGSGLTPTPPPKVVSREGLTKRLHECGWLVAHAHYVATGLAERTLRGDRPIEILRPSADPADWDGLEFRFAEGETDSSGRPEDPLQLP
ncbi:hypothetical protein [Antrihabitans stalactiti]|uniref:Uncharacterized protein n=1 Tax=Antrihabitans stalactiti TaxID=2584121 RepID=A0A848KMM0_9NOCA|nr:hypothetical protein [Antrihabitans stalactiti]NMN99479.1 hypothetical protein [Antrihabitans stalactiti]